MGTLIGMIPDASAIPRRPERKPVRKAIVLIIETDDPETFHRGMTIDMSEHGARVEADAPLAPGQTLTLYMPDDPSRSYHCTVVWTGDVGSDGCGQVGLEFIDSPPEGPEN